MVDSKQTEQPKRARWLTGLLAIIAVIFIGIPICIVISERLSWSDATSVTGVVVETLPADASIPEFVVFEYPLPDEKKGKSKIGIHFTTAHEIGAEQELIYRTKSPELAMTRIAARERIFGSYSPYGLFTCLFAGLLALAIAFPNFFRARRFFRL